MQVARKRRPQLCSLVPVSVPRICISPTHKTKGSKKGKQKKRCATKDCKKFVKVHFHKFCDACFSSRKEKSSADDSSALDDVPAAVREKNYARKLKSLKKKMAQMSSVKNKSKREELIHEANALLACFGDAVNKKNKKNKIEDEGTHTRSQCSPGLFRGSREQKE
jgi:hypothetical protein